MGDCSIASAAVSEPIAPVAQEELEVLQQTVEELQKQNKNQDNKIKEQQGRLDTLSESDEVISSEDQGQPGEITEPVLDSEQEEVAPTESSVLEQPGSLLGSLQNMLQFINPGKIIGDVLDKANPASLIEPIKKAGSWLKDLVTFF